MPDILRPMQRRAAGRCCCSCSCAVEARQKDDGRLQWSNITNFLNIFRDRWISQTVYILFYVQYTYTVHYSTCHSKSAAGGFHNFSFQPYLGWFAKPCPIAAIHPVRTKNTEYFQTGSNDQAAWLSMTQHDSAWLCDFEGFFSIAVFGRTKTVDMCIVVVLACDAIILTTHKAILQAPIFTARSQPARLPLRPVKLRQKRPHGKTWHRSAALNGRSARKLCRCVLPAAPGQQPLKVKPQTLKSARPQDAATQEYVVASQDEGSMLRARAKVWHWDPCRNPWFDSS